MLPFCAKAQERALPLPSPIQSKYQEGRPYITADKQTLFFVRRFHPENIKGEKGPQDIWLSKRNADGSWGKPQHMGEIINNKRANFLVAANANGTELILINARYKKMRTELVRAVKKGSSWELSEIIFAGFFNRSEYQDFHFDFDHNVLLSAIEKDDGYGGQDIHYSLWNEEEQVYNTPINLGNVINTNRDDFAPFLCADGRTLFFASYGHSGKGNADLYMSRRMGESWTNWSTPVNLGDLFNTRNEETYLSISGDYEEIYFDSYPPGSNNRNIMSGLLPNEFKPLPEKESIPVAESKQIETKELEKPDKEIIANAKESEQTEKTKPLDKPSEEKDNTEANAAGKTSGQRIEGETIIDLEGTDKAITITSKSAITESAKNNSTNFNFPTELLTKRVFEGGKITTRILRNIYFDFDNANYRIGYEPYMDLIGEYLKENSNMKLILKGHTDAIGGENINLELSCRRAESVKTYLVHNHGIPTSKIDIECLGDQKPIASNDDEVQGREFNRRVELRMIRD